MFEGDSFSKIPRAKVNLKCVWQFANPDNIALFVASIIFASGYFFSTWEFSTISAIILFSIINDWFS